MMKFVLGACTVATVLCATPVAAAPVYDAYSSFTGTNTGGQFSYGTFDGTDFTLFNDTAGCAGLISGTICTSDGYLPAAFKSTTGAHQSGTVIVPADALILHPGPNAGQASAVVFTAPKAGTYNIYLSAFVADNNPSGVGLDIFQPGLLGLQIGTLSAFNPTFSLQPVTVMAKAGEKFGFAVDYAGVYYNDSTGVNFTVTSVPEPATWALMVVGFGLVGYGMRRKNALAASKSFKGAFLA